MCQALSLLWPPSYPSDSFASLLLMFSKLDLKIFQTSAFHSWFVVLSNSNLNLFTKHSSQYVEQSLVQIVF